MSKGSRNNISVVIDDAIPFIKGIVEPFASVLYLPGREITRERIMNADALIIRTRTTCNEKLLEGTRVSFIASATIGYDHIDTGYCRRRGISWTTAPGCNSGSVKQYMTAALLHLCDRFSLEPGHLTVGIVGAGNVGSKVASAAGALGFKVLVNDPPRQRREKKGGFVSLDHLVSHSDIVTLHVPLTLKGRDATFHLAGSRFIEKMKRGAFLINTSRGGVTGEEEVNRALLTGQLGGYIADVWSGEPAADRELISMSLIATPHIAGYSADGKLNATAMAIRSFSEFFQVSPAIPHTGLLPVPPDPSPDYSGLKASATEVIKRYVSHTYDIIADSERFKANPDYFEQLRNNYPPRREFGAFSVGSGLPLSDILMKLGFRERQQS